MSLTFVEFDPVQAKKDREIELQRRRKQYPLPLDSKTREEIVRYLPFLTKHIEIINPKILILLGGSALNAVIGDEKKISEIRGKWINKKIGKCNTSVIVSFHPAFLMRQPDQKAMSWIDLKMIKKKILDLNIKIEK